MGRVLLIEDHARLAQLIRKGLAGAGIAVDILDWIDEARLAIKQVSYGALILDRGLPDGDGLTLLKELRRDGSSMPCLILTARDALHDRVEGLDAGADDYLPKPFAMEELVARVQALLRRSEEYHSPVLRRGDLVLRPGAGVMCCGEEIVTLAPAELQILLLLLQSHGQIVRRSALDSAAWGLTDAVTPNALDVAIHRIRRKLGAIGSIQRIKNVRGVGFALGGDNGTE